VSVDGKPVRQLHDLVAAEPELARPEHLGLYCEAVNFLSRGYAYRSIRDVDAFKAAYEARYQAEDPSAPFDDRVPRLRDFGHSRLEDIAPPKLTGKSVVFFVEDDHLGIPYRVTAPGPANPRGEAEYESVPTVPAD
jgi:hypothetical protein